MQYLEYICTLTVTSHMRSYVWFSACGCLSVLSTFWIAEYLDFDPWIKDAQPALVGFHLAPRGTCQFESQYTSLSPGTHSSQKGPC